uniref:Uncharacterized protein n=1 Tax=Peronospora matthiolae TaxID=2874970 RepID=A0AAV1TKR1_9STRA
MAALEVDVTVDHKRDVQVGSLVHFYQQFGQLAYDTIVRISRDPDAGIELTDRRRVACVICTESKQTKMRRAKRILARTHP